MQERRDAKLIEAAGVPQEDQLDVSSQSYEIKKEIKEDRSKEEKPLWQRTWVKRVAYLAGSVFSFVLMGLSIQVINDVTGLSVYTNSPIFVLNEFTGPPVMASFLAIIFFMGMSIAFIMKAFSTTQEYNI
jgi:hypothetical protein